MDKNIIGNKNINYKKGNILIVYITISIFIMVIILTITFISYYQFTICVLDVKSEMFYTVQNSLIAYNFEELAYEHYEINNIKLYEDIEQLLRKNFVKSTYGITNIIVDEIKPYIKLSDVLLHTKR